MTNTGKISQTDLAFIKSLKKETIEKIIFFGDATICTQEKINEETFEAYLQHLVAQEKNADKKKAANEELLFFRFTQKFKGVFETFINELSIEDAQDINDGKLYQHVADDLKNACALFSEEERKHINMTFLWSWLNEYSQITVKNLELVGEKVQQQVVQEVVPDLQQGEIKDNATLQSTQIQNHVVQQNNVNNVTNVIIQQTENVRKLSLEEKELALEKGLLLLKKHKIVNEEIMKLQKLVNSNIWATMSFSFTSKDGNVFTANREDLVNLLHSTLLNYLKNRALEYKTEAEGYTVM